MGKNSSKKQNKDFFKKQNKDKACSISLGSVVRCLAVKANLEQVIRYTGDSAGIDLCHLYADKLLKISAEIKDNEAQIEAKTKVKSQLVDYEAAIKPFQDKIDALTKDKNVILAEQAVKLHEYACDHGLYVMMRERLSLISTDDYEVYAMLHDKCFVFDGFFDAKGRPEKPHYHILVAGLPTGVHKLRKITSVVDILDMIGVSFDPAYDESLVDNHAVESIVSLKDYVAYLTHETEASWRDGKRQYDRSEVITNQPEMYAAYMSGLNFIDKKAVTKSDIVSLLPSFQDLGFQRMSFEDALKTHFSPRSVNYIKASPTLLRPLEAAHLEGVNSFIGTRATTDRICVYIYGGSDIGKSHAVGHFMKAKGIDPCSLVEANASKTGKFDDVGVQTEVILCDDIHVNDTLKVADDKPTKLSRRNKGTSAWIGEYLICISNSDPLDYFNVPLDNPFYRDNPTSHPQLSRFACYKINSDGSFSKTYPCMRGSRSEAVFQKNRRADELVEIMSESIKQYCALEAVTPYDVLHYSCRLEVELDRFFRDLYSVDLRKLTSDCTAKYNKAITAYVKATYEYLAPLYDMDVIEFLRENSERSLFDKFEELIPKSFDIDASIADGLDKIIHDNVPHTPVSD